MCEENCDTCIEDKSCCNGVYRPMFGMCIGVIMHMVVIIVFIMMMIVRSISL